MENINGLRNKTLELVQGVSNMAKELRLSEKEKRINSHVNRLKRGKTVVLVCGEFKRGKSSFINALIEEKELCPVDIDITTNEVTQIQYSSREQINIYFEKESNKPPKSVGRQELPKYVTEQENEENKEQVQLVSITLPNEKLNKYNMILIDTPGVGSLSARHSEVTTAYLSLVDVILFVSDATSPLTTSELDFIRKSYKYCTNIMFLLTKIDMVRDWRLIEKENREKLVEVLSIGSDRVKIFPLSSNNKIDYMETGDEESLEDSGFTPFEEALYCELNGSVAKKLLSTPLKDIKGEIEGIRKSLALQLESCNKEAKKTGEIKSELAKLNETYKQLQKSTSKWQLLFNDESRKIRERARKIFKDGFYNLEKDIKEKSRDKFFRSNLDTMNGYIKDEIITILKDIDDFVKDSITQLEGKIYDTIALQVDLEDADLFKVDVVEINSETFNQNQTISDKAYDISRSILSGKGAFATTAGIIGGGIGVIASVLTGGALLPIMFQSAQIGAVLGGGLGVLVGIKGHSKNYDKRQEVEVLRACMEVINENKKNASDLLESNMGDLLMEIRDNVVKLIQDNQETTEKTISEVNQNYNLSSAEVNKKVKRLQELINHAAKLEKDINETIEVVEGLSNK